MDEPIRILSVIKEEVGRPRNDGTPESSRYKVPLQLSATPSALWAKLFTQNLDQPSQFGTTPRPQLARIVGDRIILDGTTIEEVEQVHGNALKLVVNLTNKQEGELLVTERREVERDAAEGQAHRKHVEEIADRMNFD